MKPGRRARRTARFLPVFGALGVAGLVLLPVGGLLLGLARGGTSFAPAAGAPSLPELLVRTGALELAVNTLILGLAVTLVSVVLGTALAWLEQRARYPGSRALASLALLPLAVPSYLLAGTLREVLGPGGVLGRPLGLPVFTGIGPAILVLTLVCTPYVQVLVGAALARLSVAEEEAARNLGAGGWRCFRRVTLPRLRPAIALGGVLVTLYVFGDFGAVAVLDCRVLTWRMFQAYETQNLPGAAALGLVALALILPLLVLGLVAQGRTARLPGTANPRDAARHALAPLAAAGAWLVHLPLVGLGVVAPAAALAAWVARGWLHGEPFAGVISPLLQTLALAATGALVTVVLASAPAWLSARRGAAWGWFVDQAAYLSGALPGVLVATGLFLVALAVQRGSGWDVYLGLRQTGVLLFAGYATHHLSQGFGGLKAAFLRLDPRQEECARSLGAGAVRRLRRVVLPAVAPGAAAAWLLLFVVLVKELPITLVLQPIGIQTLSFRVFDRYQEAFLHDAGLAGLTLLVLALAGQLATLRWRRHV